MLPIQTRAERRMLRQQEELDQQRRQQMEQPVPKVLAVPLQETSPVSWFQMILG